MWYLVYVETDTALIEMNSFVACCVFMGLYIGESMSYVCEDVCVRVHVHMKCLLQANQYNIKQSKNIND